MDEAQKTLEDMKNFMQSDMSIKESLINMAPDTTYLETEEEVATNPIFKQEQGTVEENYFTIAEMKEVAKQPKISALKRFFGKIKDCFSRSVPSNHDDKNNYDNNER
jgi:hypothetical protein